MNFITGLPRSQQWVIILLVVDRLSKASHFIALRHPYTARVVAEAFGREIIRLHGMPRSIVSDRDPLFLYIFWKEVFAATGTQLCISSAYHPDTDGQYEVMNKCLETYLCCFMLDHPNSGLIGCLWGSIASIPVSIRLRVVHLLRRFMGGSLLPCHSGYRRRLE